MIVYLAVVPTNFSYTFRGGEVCRQLQKNGFTQANILASYYYWKNVDIGELLEELEISVKVNFFIDSGGYSAWSQGVEIDVDDYIEWLAHNKQYVKDYANLDIRGDWKKTEENQKAMESAGLLPMPVYHAGEPQLKLEEMIEKYEKIAIGGIAGHFQEKNLTGQWLVKYFKLAKPETLFHGFGMAAPWIVSRFPFYSVDSLSWFYGNIIGSVVYWDFDKKKISYFKLGRSNPYQASKHIRLSGYAPEQFIGKTHVTKDTIPIVAGIGMVAYKEYERYYTEYWKKAGVK